MRDSRDQWTCISHDDAKPKISTAEMNYWRETLKKILKVGLEFEFNLPDQKGTCKGDSNACPCVKMSSDDCWKECLSKGKCSYLRNPGMCKKATKKCKPEDCMVCKDYQENAKAKCPGLFCIGFVSACFACGDFDIDCKTCTSKYDPARNPEEIRARMHQELKPSNSYGEIRDFGVHSITTDGSLLGQKGAEIITVGRRVDYWEFFKMAQAIIDKSVEKGAWTNERCSIHMHLLGSYYSKIFQNDEAAGIPSQINELEKPLPEIILANFHQLCRRYQNAITWMTTALDEPQRLTRWEKFRVSVLDISAILNTMSSVKDLVSTNAGGNKYGWVNYNFTAFDQKGNVNRLHLEMRVADMLLSPSAVAAIACLFHAMMIKAVEISRYGIIEVGDNVWMEQANTIKNALMNGIGSYDGERFSDTKNLARYYDILSTEALDLVSQVKHILLRMGPAYDVLEKLAERPCSLRRIDGATWEEIENTLSVVTNEDDKLHIAVDECIDLRYVSECKSLDEWIIQTAIILGENTELDITDGKEITKRVEEYITRRRNDGEMIWSESLGSIIKL